ncbi:hydantoinase/oxoprolinase family protein [Variovorax sp. E3]|uniref:hydantoinase/oxoprolinase family protein n=1 Tax=Variovorax sp. E3 TaxID=1914993 RepID=UPI0022B75308|nr:hydantoinase/oxoprolinase family protein [Variovorax sp. E3]
MNALRLMAEGQGLGVREILARTAAINFGTTVATNAMLQNKGVPTAMLTTKGFRDVVELRRGYKEVLFDLQLAPPEELVTRRWRLSICERVGPAGQVILPLAEEEVREAARKMSDEGIQSVAVCYLNSFLNPAHELRTAEILREEMPEIDVFVSSQVLPKIREFERFSTTVVNAAMSPLLRTYLERLMLQLRENGFRNELLVMQSNGGNTAPDQAGRMGCAFLLSGPAGGVAAMSRVGTACGYPNVIGVDMGGTSYDVSLVRNATPETRTETWFNRQFVGIPMLAIHTIGAGGGSIAWVDAGGALRMGPQSAGARPGPACYGAGGTSATSSDAFLYLGYVNPDYFLGGRMKLHRDLSAEAIRKNVAEPLGMGVDEAAYSMLRIINNNMSNGIRYVSVAEGHDPRDFALMSFGGAGSITVGTQARDLGIRKVLVPRTASVFCALGELLADLRRPQLLPVSGRLEELDADKLVAQLDQLAESASSDLGKLPGVQGVVVERFAELRYAGQVHELATPMPVGPGSPAAILAQTVESFHDLHKQRYAFSNPGAPIEILAVRQDVIGARGATVSKSREKAEGPAEAAIKQRRKVCFDAGGDRFEWIDTPIYDAAKLHPGHHFAGPAVIEATDTTIVLQPQDMCRINEYDVFEIDIPEERGQ